MKSIFILLINLILILSCGSENELVLDSKIIIGKWADLNDYESTQTTDGMTQTVSFPNIEYEFYEDGTYEVSNDFVLGIHRNGTWSIDEQENILEFLVEMNALDSLLGVQQTFKWDILNLEADLLEVNYSVSQDSVIGVSSFDLDIYRRFEKID